MPLYQVDVDGQTVEFDSPVDLTPEQLEAEVSGFRSQIAPPAAPEEAPGYLSQLGTSLYQGGRQALGGARTAFNALTGDTADMAAGLQQQAEAQRALQEAQTPEDVAFLEDLNKQAEELKQARGFLPTLSEAIDLPMAALRQPGAAIKTAVQSLPNALISTPITLGAGLVGTAAGGLVGLPTTGPGAVATGIAGGIAAGTAANTALEAGSEIYQRFVERIGDPAGMTREQIAAALDQNPDIASEGLTTGLTRGAVIGTIETLGLKGAGALLAAPERAAIQATRQVLTRSGVDLADDAAVRAAMATPEMAKATKAAADAARAGFNVPARAVGAGAVEIGASGVGEALAQQAVGQETDYADVFLEMLGEGVAAAPSVLAARGVELAGTGIQAVRERVSEQVADNAKADARLDIDDLINNAGENAAIQVNQAVDDAAKVVPAGQPTDRAAQIKARLAEIEAQFGPPDQTTFDAQGNPVTTHYRVMTTEESRLRQEIADLGAVAPALAPAPAAAAAPAAAQQQAPTPVKSEAVTVTANGKRVGDKVDPGENLSTPIEEDLSSPNMPVEYTVVEVSRIIDPAKNEVEVRRRDMTPAEIAEAQQKIRQRNEVAAEMGLAQSPIPEAPASVSEPTPITPQSLPTGQAQAPAPGAATQTQPTLPNALETRQIPEDGQFQRQYADEGGPTAEAGGGNRPVQGGQVQAQEVTAEPVQPMEVAPAPIKASELEIGDTFQIGDRVYQLGSKLRDGRLRATQLDPTTFEPLSTPAGYAAGTGVVIPKNRNVNRVQRPLPAPQAEIVSPEGVTPPQPLPPTGGVPTESLPAGQPTSGDVGTALRAVATNTATLEQVASLEAQGLARTVQGQPVITDAGLALMPEAERPRLTEAERVAEIDGQGGIMASLIDTDAAYTAALQGDSGNDNLTELLRAASKADRQKVLNDWITRNPQSAAELQQRVDEAVSKSRLTLAWRAVGGDVGSQNASGGFYATSKRAVAEFFAGTTGRVERVAIRLGKTQEVREDTGPDAYDSLESFRIAESEFGDSDFDSISALDIPDGPENSDVFVVRKQSQIKSADPITYDDAGNVIPLSQRFQPESPDIRFSVRNTPPANVQPSIRPLQGDQQRNETSARRRRGKAQVPASLRDRDGPPLPNIKVNANDGARAREIEDKQVPGAKDTWIGTVAEYLAEFPDQTAVNDRRVEAFYDAATDRAVILIDRVVARDGDAIRAARNGTSAAVEAVRRLIRHESFVHRGWRALPQNLKTEFLGIAESLVPEEEINAIVAKGYSRYANWSTDPAVRALVVEEWLAQRLETLEKLPATDGGPLSRLIDWAKRVWQWLNGNDAVEPTRAELVDVMRQMIRALEIGEKSREVAEPIRPSFIGEKAEMSQFMRDSLETARSMAAAGKPSEEIRAVTGWFPGPYDGKMRWELPDNEAAFVDADTFNNAAVATYGGQVFNRLPIQTIVDRIKSGNYVKLSDVFNHPKLFAAYPDAANIPFFPIGGNVVQGSHRIVDGNSVITATVLLDESGQISEESTSVLLHELQHYIQNREGFAKGGSPDSLLTRADLQDAIKFRDAYKGIQKYRKQIADLVDVMAREQAKTGFLGFGGPSQKAIKSIEDQIKAIQDSVNAVWEAQGKALSLDRDSTRAALLSAINKVEDELGASWVLQNRNEGLNRIYKRVAGEIEARDVQARRTMTPEQRRATAPYSSENIAPEDAVVIFDGREQGVMASLTDTDAAYMDALQGDNGNDNLTEQLRAATEADRQGVLNDWIARNPQSAATLQQRVDEAAKAAGYDTYPWYHGGTLDPEKDPIPRIKEGKKSKSNMQLDFGLHLARDRNEALAYAGSKNSRVSTVYLTQRGEPILDLSNDASWIVTSEIGKKFGPKISKAIEKQRQQNKAFGAEVDLVTGEVPVYPAQLESILTSVPPKEAYDALRSAGYSGAQYTAKANYGTGRYRPFKAVTVIGSPNQVKLADPITYDDAGNIIPPSQRFQPESPDIRFSLTDPTASNIIQDANQTTNEQQPTRSRPLSPETAPGRATEVLPTGEEIVERTQIDKTSMPRLEALAIKFVDSLGPVDTWPNKILNTAWWKANGGNMRDDFGQMVMAEALYRTGIGALQGNPTLVEVNDLISREYQTGATEAAKALASRSYVTTSERYGPMFAVQGMVDQRRRQQETVIDANVDVAAGVDAVNNADAQAQSDASAELDEELRLKDAIYELGLAARTPEIQTRIRRINDNVFRLGVLAQIREQLLSRVQASFVGLSRAAVEQQYANLSVEQIDAEIARLEREVADDVAAVESERQRVRVAPKPKGAAADPITQARTIIARLEADPKTKKTPKANPVRDLYREHLKNPMAEDEFMTRMAGIGVPAAEAQKLYDLAAVKIAATEAVKAQREAESKEDSPAVAFAKRTIDDVASRLADPALPQEERQRKVLAIRELYKEHVRDGLPFDVFISRAEAAGVEGAMASTLHGVGLMEREARETTRGYNEAQAGQRFAEKTINDAATLYADPALPQPVRNKRRVAAQELYNKHVKKAMAQAEFLEAARKAGVNEATAMVLFNVGNMTREAREAQAYGRRLIERRERLLDAEGSALENLINKLRGKITGDLSWREMFDRPLETQRQWRRDLFAALRNDPALAGLTPQEIGDLVVEIDKVWEAKRKKNFEAQLKRMNLPGAKGNSKDKIVKSAPKLLRYINAGFFNDAAFRNAISEEFGIPALNEETVKQVVDLMQRAQADGITEVERKGLMIEAIRLMQRDLKAELGDILSNYWVTSVLSGFATQFDMAFSALNGMRVMAQSMADLAIRKREFKLAGRAGMAYLRALGNVILEAARYFYTGDPKLLDNYQYTLNTYLTEGSAAANPFDYFERIIKDPNRPSWKKIMPYFYAGLQRAMTAFDHINSTATTQGMLEMAMFYNRELYEGARMPSKEDVAAARAKAVEMVGGDKTWGQKREVSSYTRQILNELLNKKYPGLLDEARDIGKVVSYTNDPTGIGGIVYHTLLGVTNKYINEAGEYRDKVRAQQEAASRTKRFMANLNYLTAANARNMTGLRFVRFVGNRLNEILSFTPGLGLLRLQEKGMTPTMRAMIIQNQTLGLSLSVLAGVTILRALTDEEDDEKRGFRISGSWSSLPPDKKNQLRASGRSPYAIELWDGKKWISFNYNAWPVASIIATAGNLNDQRLFNPEKWEEKDFEDKLLSAAWAGAFSFKDLSALSGFMDMIGKSAYSTDPVEGATQWLAKFSTNYVGGFAPRMLKDIDLIMDPETRKARDFGAYFAKELPFFRRTEAAGEKLYNIFGEPVKLNRMPWRRAVTATREEPEYETLAELNRRGIFLGAANPSNRTVGSGATRRELTDAEAEKYMVETGKLYRDFIKQQGQSLLQLDRAQAEEVISKTTERLRAAALRMSIGATK